MASTRKVKSNSPTVTRKRHAEEFKREALALAQRIGVPDAASKKK